MARPKQGVDAYADIRPIWVSAITHGTIDFTMPSEREAISMIQRLHYLRQLWRQQQDINYIMADKFVVRREHNKVVLEQKEVFDVSKIRTADGTFVNKARVQQYMIDDDMAALQREGINTKIFEQQTPEPVDTFDPDAPLGLTEE